VSPSPVLVELCAGMVGLSLRLAGRQRLVKYRGGKWKLARDLIALGGIKPPPRFVWAEANPHARRFLATFSDPTVSAGAVEVMTRWIGEGPEAMVARWWKINKDFKTLWQIYSSDAEHCAAFYLWRQAEGLQGRPVVQHLGLRGPGGDLKNLELRHRTWIVEKIAAAALTFSGMTAEIYEDAGAVAPFRDAVVYVDPPYLGTVGYSELDLSRERVVELALAWDRAGAQVIVSEGSPVEELVAKGWHSCRIADRLGCGQECKPEHVTTNREPYSDFPDFSW